MDPPIGIRRQTALDRDERIADPQRHRARLAAAGLWISKLLDSLEISAELRAEIGRQLDAMSHGVFPKGRDGAA